ncbi:MAG: putative Ig domain-containing protein, partial [Defluviitaleaceae bacterium]|nr:putative Ig domain-containing protein [Defluviitaleaceae bacterium]
KQAFWDIVALVDDPAPLSPPEIITEQLPQGNVNSVFSYALAATGITPMWSIEEGDLPEGLRIVPASGIIFGTPVEEGEFTVTFRATNPSGSGTTTLTLLVDEALVIEEAEEPPTEDETNSLAESVIASTPENPPIETDETSEDVRTNRALIAIPIILIVAGFTGLMFWPVIRSAKG